MREDELLASGHRTCAGCGSIIAIRQAMRVIGDDVIVCQATGCMEVTTTPYPETSWKVPWIHSLFENPTAVASGISAALKKQGKDTKVVSFGGDGSTYDIGFGSLSGMLERNEDVLYICTDNEAYMNTGVQRSGGTPRYASTTTSPPGKVSKGKIQFKKPIVDIAAAHHIPYVAQASIGYHIDFRDKVKKALEYEGSKVIVVLSPCPPGWGADASKTVDISKLAVETGLWPLLEIVEGEKRYTYTPTERKPVEDYLKLQKRFKHLNPDDIADIQAQVDKYWEKALS